MARSYFKAKYWASKYFTVFVEDDEEEKPRFLPFAVGYSLLRDRPPHKEKRLTPEMIFGKDARKDPQPQQKRRPADEAQLPDVVVSPAQKQIVVAPSVAVQREAERGNLFDLFPERFPKEAFDEASVKRMLEQIRDNARLAQEVEAKRKTAAMVLMLMMEM
jgi:hypothetical protein